MNYEVNDRELESVISLPGPNRYEYFINKIADWEDIWSIADQRGWALVSDQAGSECVPVWPAKAFAEIACIGEWSRSQARSIPLDEWMTKWIPGMSKDNRKVAVFPIPGDKGVVVDPNRLAHDIEEALTAYE